MELAAKIREYVEEALVDPQYFLVEVVKSANGKLVSVLLDGDAGIPIAECSRVSRSISARIDEEIPDEVGAFTVEVSSPGVDRPLKQLRQFPKHIGRNLEFVDGEGKKRNGRLVNIQDGVLTLEESFKEKGKKRQVALNTYNFEQINDPRVVVSFKL